jgi:uncharacterized protein
MEGATLQILDSIDAVSAAEWNRLAGTGYPFLRHELLAALERQGCLGETYGWLPRHLLLRDGTGTLMAAAPCYLKLNSYGELVFDWSWADAYRRAGLSYYPKLVVACPYTPATGPRMLTADPTCRPEIARVLVRGAVQAAREMGVSSLHWLFVTEEESRWLADEGLMCRTGCQFHWESRGYRDFDDYLSAFTARKRKQIKRERRRVAEQGIQFRQLRGGEVSDGEWDVFHRLYRSTFDRHGGIPTLSPGFFREIASTMGEQILLVLAYAGTRPVAGAFNLVGENTLYGRHWGCFEDYHSLHFETCYYQGLDFCIREGLRHFEPGAQGEHKISRGFLPTPTWSNHWIADQRFRTLIRRFLDQETPAMQEYQTEMQTHSPYRNRRRPAQPD